MSTTPETGTQTGKFGTIEGSDNLATTLLNLLKRSLGSSDTTNTSQSNQNISESLTSTVKLNELNYPVWAILMKDVIRGRRRLNHITRVPPPAYPKEST